MGALVWMKKQVSKLEKNGGIVSTKGMVKIMYVNSVKVKMLKLKRTEEVHFSNNISYFSNYETGLILFLAGM